MLIILITKMIIIDRLLIIVTTTTVAYTLEVSEHFALKNSIYKIVKIICPIVYLFSGTNLFIHQFYQWNF